MSALAPSFTYAYARYSLDGRWNGIRTIPSMLMLGCGLCLNNTLAVVRGLYLTGGEFVRTPKSGSADCAVKQSTYGVATSQMWLAEIVLGIYSGVSFVVYVNQSHRAFSIFLLLYAVGFCVVGWMSRPGRHGRAVEPAAVPPLLGAEMSAVESPAGG